jgi:hypothetical protein
MGDSDMLTVGMPCPHTCIVVLDPTKLLLHTSVLGNQQNHSKENNGAMMLTLHTRDSLHFHNFAMDL